MNEEVTRNEISRNIDKDEEDTRIMITKTARFSMNEKAILRKKIKTWNEEALVLILEKGNDFVEQQHLKE